MNNRTAVMALALVAALTGPLAAFELLGTESTYNPRATAWWDSWEKTCPDWREGKYTNWCGYYVYYIYHMAGLPTGVVDPDARANSQEASEVEGSLNKCASHTPWDYRCRAHVRAVWAKYTRTFDSLDGLELPYRKSTKGK